MAVRLFLALAALVAVMWYLSWYRRADSRKRGRSLIAIALYGAAALLLILVVTGKIPWLFALLSAAVPWINRMLTVRRLWSAFSQRNPGGGHKAPPGQSRPSMSREEAFEILGLKPGAGEEEIIEAHRKLMQKIHPDRGGSDYLAAQINLAKEILLDGLS